MPLSHRSLPLSIPELRYFAKWKVSLIVKNRVPLIVVKDKLGIYNRELCVASVNVKGILDHPHNWGTDELMQKQPRRIFAPQAISS